jgi:hypothetical protein
METKPRSNAKLKALPEERQAEIYERLQKGTLAEVRDWLRDDGIEVSRETLSQFNSWYPLVQEFREDNSTVEALVDRLSEQRPDLTPDQRFAVGQEAFELLAIRRHDEKSWTRLQRLNLLRDAHALNEKRFKRETADLFLKWAEDKRAIEIAASGASNTDKLEQLGKLMFGEEWG